MVPTISSTVPTPAQRPPAPHYQTYLTPELHRRFLRAGGVALTACYIETFLVTDKTNLFWAVLPISNTGTKCFILLVLSAIPVLLLRVSQLHVSTRADPSPFYTVRRCVGSFSTYTALFTYILSSTVFTSLYLFSSSASDRLSFIVEGRSYERPRLNERFLYLVFLGSFAGLVQGVYHVIRDRGRITLSAIEDTESKGRGRIVPNIPDIMSTVGHLTAISTVGGIVSYLPLRSTIFRYTLFWARQFYWLNRSTALPSFPIGPGMFIRSAWICMLICTLSEVIHQAFSAHFSQPPVQGSEPVSDKSSDPNGTLVTGLRAAKAPLAQTMAFSELAYISKYRPERRCTVFKDVERKPNMWEQILKECIATLSDVELRLNELNSTSAPAPAATDPSPETDGAPSAPSVPISPNDGFLSSPDSKSRLLISSLQTDNVSLDLNIGRKIPIRPPITLAEAQASSMEKIKQHTMTFLGSPWGVPFRQTVRATASQILPNVRLQVDATTAVTRLICASLAEDEFGVVQTHVPAILQCFCTTLEALENFIREPKVHWTDVEWTQHGPYRLEEPEELVQCLRDGIGQIAMAFGPYLDEILPPDVKRRIVGT